MPPTAVVRTGVDWFATVPRPVIICSMGFIILFAIDAIIALVVLGFFFWGLTDGSVSSFNILLWLVLIGAVGATLVGSLILRANGRPRIANGLLALLAWPGCLIGFFFLMLILVPVRGNR